MKLDKMKFARLVCFLTSQLGHLTDDVIEDLDNMIDVQVPATQEIKPSVSEVDELLRNLNHPDRFIPAIKAYRALTGTGLKEAKEAVERYRNYNKPVPVPVYASEGATLGDILKTATNQTGE